MTNMLLLLHLEVSTLCIIFCKTEINKRQKNKNISGKGNPYPSIIIDESD